MRRRGFVLPALLLAASAAGLLTTALLVAVAQRSYRARQHQACIQGREWCLGAVHLAAGTELDVGGWRITVASAGAVSAAGPRGTYRIAADGRESWSRTP